MDNPRRALAAAALALSLGADTNAEDRTPTSSGGENASNPLASVNNVDLRYQYFDLGDADRHDAYIDGAHMVLPELKLKYELHYWETNVTGRSEAAFESLVVKPIYFPKSGELGTWKYKLAIGLEWNIDFDHFDKGIGSGADQLAPFIGVALSSHERGLSVIPLVQHFVSYSGNDVNQTSFRLIGIKSLPSNVWVKADAKVPIDWENDNAIPASFEVQVGKTLTPGFGIYGEGLFGIGGDRPYDVGGGVGVRFKY
jgi:hypothetical protein